MSSVPESFRCDSCDKNRVDDVNHWLSAIVNEKGIRFAPGVIRGKKHYCGLTCATKAFMNWFYESIKPKPE